MTNQIRASDQDREQLVERLNEAVGKGLLTLPEAEERIAAAYAAKFLDDLTPLTADLPQPAPTPPPRRQGRRGPGFDPRVLVVLAALATLLVVTHGFFFPLIPLAFLALRFGPWRRAWGRPARM